MKLMGKNIEINFLVVPLVTLIILPNISDPHGIPKLISLVIGTSFLVVKYIHNLRIRNFTQILAWLMVVLYSIIQIISKDDLAKFFLGAFMRNGGLISLVSFAIVFTIISNTQPQFLLTQFIRVFRITFYLLILYGLVEKFGILPFTQDSQYEDSISLTLTNPNFASSYLAISITIIFLTFERRNLLRIGLDLLACAVGFIFLFDTNSIQGLLIIILNIFLFFILKLNKYRETSPNSLKYSSAAALLLVIALSSSTLWQWISANGSVAQRISYWKLSFEIFKDNWVIGVGIDNLRESVTAYRDLALVKQEGVFTLIDRSHNVILDHFVNGGIITGLVWLSFVILISMKAFQILFFKTDAVVQTNHIVVVFIWFGYLFQSLISVDHLALTLLGYISAGFIMSIAYENKVKKLNIEDQKTKSSKMNYFIAFTAISFFVLSQIFMAKIVQFEYYCHKYLYYNDETYLSKVYNSRLVTSQSLEEVAVKISQSKNFDLANSFANKLLLHRPVSHQAYYMKSVNFESMGRINEAKTEMLTALKIDRFNPVYLLSMAIYEFNLGNVAESKNYLARTIEIDPKQKGIEIVRKLLENK
jgi:tetratricopeptide (TPR) repeat protein